MVPPERRCIVHMCRNERATVRDAWCLTHLMPSLKNLSRHKNAPPRRGAVPMVYEFDCICIVCGRRTSVLWTEQMAILYQQSGLLKCADCRGAILIERSDLGAIGSAHAVRTSRYETPVKTRPGA